VERPRIYFDFGSPYAYLALERAESVLGAEVALEPVLLGAIFKRRGRGSWAETAHRGPGMREVEIRAARYGLPALDWPPGWPTTSLAADRAGLWAKRRGVLARFAPALFREQFVHGADISDLRVLARVADASGLDGEELPVAIERSEIKDALRQSTDDAWSRGVKGVPTIEVGSRLFYGDDQLELAAAALRSAAEV
jgi:2-hydroxychromene-2-carboxylate isomerase